MAFDLNSEPRLHTRMFSWEMSCEDSEIARHTEMIYAQAWEMAKDLSLPYPIRIWNRIPRINDFHKDLENYQAFCAGRKRVFDRVALAREDYPAASAVGSIVGTLSCRFLFSNVKPLIITNPRQTEAYDYPKVYGPTPPSFARGCLHGKDFYLSGTASIRGHETLFSGNLRAQLDLTLENIRIVLREARMLSQMSQMNWTIFLRHPENQHEIHYLLQRELGHSLTFVPADICRRDLLIEIEGAYHGL
jgi:chorismate lyase / 3-hydroxybenzoate synthase